MINRDKNKYRNKYRIPSSRLQNWDYRKNAAYFVTICTKNRECYFGDVVCGKMHLSNIGETAHAFWLEIPRHFSSVKLNDYIVMPNHFHGVVVIDTPDCEIEMDDSGVDALPVGVFPVEDTLPVETLHATSLPAVKNDRMAAISPKPGSLSAIVRSYKSAVTRHARRIDPDFSWQSRFHDHIIRNDESYQTIVEYIKNNPLKWGEDKYYAPGDKGRIE